MKKDDLVALDKKGKKAMVKIMEPRSINSKGSGRKAIPCSLTMIGYVPESLQQEEDKEIPEEIGGTAGAVYREN